MGRESQYLQAVYDAALSDEHWPRALAALSDQISCVGALLMAVDQVGLPFRIDQASSVYRPEDVRYYLENFGHYDNANLEATTHIPPMRLLHRRLRPVGGHWRARGPAGLRMDAQQYRVAAQGGRAAFARQGLVRRDGVPVRRGVERPGRCHAGRARHAASAHRQGSAAEIATTRDVSEDTVKSQFKAVYGKTGERRRADLVRLALAVDPPIARPGDD